MEKINIAEILRHCPKGMELDCTMYDNLYFDEVDTIGDIKCYIKSEDDCLTRVTFHENGCYNTISNSKCVIFPKGKTTWEGFQRPFKDGDIIYIRDEYSDATFTYVAILKQIKGEQIYSYCFYDYQSDKLSTDDYLYDGYNIRFATEEEKQKLFKAIKDNDYKWDPETNTLKKLIVPKFKVGDRVNSKMDQIVYTIIDIKDDVYFMQADVTGFCYHISFDKERYYELVPNKFDITTLNPFDKVLVRDTTNQYWSVNLFGYYLHGFPYPFCCSGNCTTTGFKQCIPYEGNEHLLGTTDDCNNYYKTWE